MKFSPLQISFVMILFVGISSHVIIVPHLLTAAKRDAWVSGLISYVILLIWGIVIYLIMKKMGNQKLYSWIKSRAGAAVSRIIVFILFIYILFLGMDSFYEVMMRINIYFLPRTPLIIVAISFLLLCLGATSGGFKTIVYMSIILLPIVWIFGMFVATAALNDKDYSFLQPVLIHGFNPVVKGTAVAISGNVDLIILFTLQHHLKKTYSFFHLTVLITILVGILMGLTMGVISAFGPNVAAELRFPAFEEWRLISLGNNISHLDFLAVFQTLAGTTIKVALCLFLLTDLWEISSIKITWMIKIFISLVFLFALFLKSDIWVQTISQKYIYPNLFIYGLVISILLLIICYIPAKKGIQPS